MNFTSHLLQRLLKLAPPTTRDLVVQRDLRVPMPDGVELLADRWAPQDGGDGLPTALIRSPYGRRGLFGLTMARPLAERGFQVLIAEHPRHVRLGRDVRPDATASATTVWPRSTGW